MDDWRALLEIAIHAPSPHNVQPWRVRVVSDDAAELWIEKHRTLPKEDVTGSFIILTMGMFLETLGLAAAHRGLAVEWTLVHPPDWYRAENLERQPQALLPFARLSLRPDPQVRADVPLELIRRRQTSRLPYGREPVTPEHATQLDQVARPWNHRYGQIVEAARVERLLGWNIDAVIADLNHAPYREEMSGWLRYFEATSSRHRDGLDARCMNVAPWELWFPFRWPGALRWPPTERWFRKRYRQQIGPVATLGYLSGKFWDPRDAFDCGRFLVRFWLECTRLGYFIHPYGNLVTHRPVAERVEQELGEKLIWLVFKIGRCATPPRSRRRSVDQVLLDADATPAAPAGG
jgi:hypothetical protein